MFFALLFSWISAAAIPPLVPESAIAGCSLLGLADFIPALEGIRKTKLPVAVLAASPKITIDDEFGGVRCSSSVISDRGTILTAGHCIKYCLETQGAVRDFSAEGKSAMQMIDLSRKPGVPLFCQGTIDGKPMEFRVIAAQQCAVQEGVGPSVPADALSACTNSPDFAILQPAFPTKGQPCLQAEVVANPLGLRALAVGFPSATQRKEKDSEARDSNGQDQYVSFGNVVKDEHCTVSTKEFFGLLRGEESKNIIGGTTAHAQYIQVSADTVPGSSGGSLVNEETGKLIGVVALSASNHSQFCKGSTFATSMQQIHDAIRDEDLFGRLFACDQNAVKP